MPDDPAVTHQSVERSASPVDVLETDSGRKPIWGILAIVGFFVFAVFAVWRVTAGDSNSPPSYSSNVSIATIVSEGDSASGSTNVTMPRRDSTAATVFFFALVGAMALVGALIILRRRQISRAAP